MLKRLPLLVAALSLAAMVYAQGLNVSGNRVLKNFPRGQRTEMMRYEQSPRFARYHAPQRAIEVDTDRQLWWGYHPDILSTLASIGPNAPGTCWAAIGIPTTEMMAKGKSIKAVRFALVGVTHLKNVHLWVAESLPQSLDEVMLDVSVDANSLVNEGFTEVELPELFPIPNRTLYVGYTFDIAETEDGAGYPIMFYYNGANQDNSCWTKLMGISNNQWTDDMKAYGPVAIQLLLDGDFPHNAVAVEPGFLDVFALPNGSAEATITLTSKGLGEVSSIDYFVSDANTDYDEVHLEFEPFGGLNAQKQVRIPLTADSKPGRSPRSITITQVNGVDNQVEDATTDGFFVTLSRAVERRTLVEEFTGTWCGWCPRGITGLEKVNELMGDRAITIAIHNDDPMAIDYGVSPGAGYPSAYVDRTTVCDPYFGVDRLKGLWGLVEESNKVLAEASVGVESPVLGKNGKITFKTNVCFNYTYSKSAYALGYVIVADGLTGTGRKWMQANYYCDPGVKDDWVGYTDLAEWINGQNYIPMTYDHVAIAASGMSEGADKIKASIKDGDTISVSSSIDITGNPVLQSMDKLKLVSVLFNTVSGNIVNADIQPVTVASDFAVNKMQVKAFETLSVIKGEVIQVPVPVANFGSAGIHSIDYSVRANGTVSDTMRLELKKPVTTLGIYENVNFPVTAPAESGVQSHTINIVAVNGEKNEATTGKISTGTIIAMAKSSKRRTAVEEFTGTWCGWCPRGLAGLKRARAEYPDDVVLMSIHGGSTTEPMQVSAFNSLLGSIGDYPSAYVNRYRSVDPYNGELEESEWGLGTVIEDENRKMVEAAVELQQPVLDEETGVINFTTDVHFQINRKSAPYLMSYVLVADGLHGEGDDWLQVNYYTYCAGEFQDDPYMNEVCNIWGSSVDLTFNDVAVAGLGVGSGVSGSLKTTVEEGQTQSHSGKFNIKSNKLALMATELRVIALLYDKTRQIIINADEKKVVSSSDTPVRDLNTTIGAAPLQRYGLDGIQQTPKTRGFQLIRMSDGSVRKVLNR